MRVWPERVLQGVSCKSWRLFEGGREELLHGQCRVTKANGDVCKGAATGPNGLCWAHDPANAEQRQRTASKAGRSRSNVEVRAVKTRLEQLYADLLAGRVESRVAAVAAQVSNTQLRAIELDNRLKENAELEQKLDAVGELLEEAERRGIASW